MNTPHLSRREAILAGAAALALPSIPALARTRGTPKPLAPRARLLRIAHLTDIHVQPERRAGEGMAACLDHVMAQQDKPELVVTGGDSVMDSFEQTIERTRTQWEVWHKTLKDHCSIPVLSAVGNHDVWGINKTKSKSTGTEEHYGKRMAEEMLKIPRRYHSSTKNGWKFIVLDSTFPQGDGYVALLDDPQFEWLKGELDSTPAATFICIVSHIPILSMTPLLWEENKNGGWKVSDSLMHRDMLKLRQLFARYRNVKLCLSGHLHLVDRVDYDGVSYMCNGAVSGNWWKGKHRECDEGYATIDLFNDGTFDRTYHTYGWKAEPEKPAKP